MRLPGRASRQVYRVYEEDEYLAQAGSGAPGPEAPIVGAAGSSRGLLALCLLVAAVLSVAVVVLVNAIRSTTGSRRTIAARSAPMSGDGARAAHGTRPRPAPARSRRLRWYAPAAPVRSTGAQAERRLGGAAGAPSRRPVHIDRLASALPASVGDRAISTHVWPIEAPPPAAEPALHEFGFER